MSIRTVWRLALTSVTCSPSSARTCSSRPHSGGGCAPGGGGGAYGFIVANICPMNPSGVQLSRPMVPPGRQTRISSSALAWWYGANMTPRQDITVSNSPPANGRGSAAGRPRYPRGTPLPPPPPQPRPPPRGLPLPGLEQFRGQVAGHHAGSRLGGRDRGVAGSGGHVEHAVPGPDLARGGQDRAQLRDEIGGHGRIVAERPHGAVLRLHRPARLGGTRGFGRHVGFLPLF